jgi:hypothetical protein
MTDVQVATQVYVASVVPGTLSTAICSGLPRRCAPAILSRTGTKSRETIVMRGPTRKIAPLYEHSAIRTRRMTDADLRPPYKIAHG